MSGWWWIYNHDRDDDDDDDDDDNDDDDDDDDNADCNDYDDNDNDDDDHRKKTAILNFNQLFPFSRFTCASALQAVIMMKLKRQLYLTLIKYSYSVGLLVHPHCRWS